MWLINSSIGRKLIMAVTGVCLILFVTFHVLMNAVALIWPTAYNQVCEFLGANWYALVASVGLAALFIIHIIYAVWLTVQNRAARGNDRYAVTTRPPQVEWASKNMLVLGVVILAFLVVHLIQFWAKMQWQELRHAELAVLPQLNGVPVEPAQGTLFLEMAFSQTWTLVVYIIGFVALWFHMNHGFWSMFQSAGWNNQNWLPRLKTIGLYWTSIVVGLFLVQAVVFTIQAKDHYYTKNIELQEQYAATYNKVVDETVEKFKAEVFKMQMSMQQGSVTEMQAAEKAFFENEGVPFIEKMENLYAIFTLRCPDIAYSENLLVGYQQAQSLKQACANYGIAVKDPVVKLPNEETETQNK